MRAAEHAACGEPGGRLATLRRSGALALAALATLVTLVLPAPALARPVGPAVGSSTTTGPGGTGSTQAGRRHHRGEVTRTSRSLTGSRSTAPAVTTGSLATTGSVATAATSASSGAQVRSAAQVTAAQVTGVGAAPAGHLLVAAVPAAVRTSARDRCAVGSAGRGPVLEPASTGPSGSRAPPRA